MARNKYARVRRKEEKGYERNRVEKCNEEPKLLYRFINSKINPKDKTEKLGDGNKLIEDPCQDGTLKRKLSTSISEEISI